jgi:hypothetical protein
MLLFLFNQASKRCFDLFVVGSMYAESYLVSLFAKDFPTILASSRGLVESSQVGIYTEEALRIALQAGEPRFGKHTPDIAVRIEVDSERPPTTIFFDAFCFDSNTLYNETKQAKIAKYQEHCNIMVTVGFGRKDEHQSLRIEVSGDREEYRALMRRYFPAFPVTSDEISTHSLLLQVCSCMK